jgi:archaellum component FlaC
MSESSEIQEIREEIRELRLLYRKLAEDLIPEEEPTPEEVEALDAEPKEYLSEGELLDLLRPEAGRKPGRSSSG